MKRLLVALLVCATAAAGLVSSVSPASGAADTINFDEQPNFAYITNQYASRGVTFLGSGVYAVNDPSVARSDPNYIAPADYPGQEFSATPIDIAFSPPQSRVRLWVGHAGARTNHVVTMRAFDGAGQVVASASGTLGAAPSAVVLPLEVSVSTASIARIDVNDSYSSTSVRADDLEFSRPDPVLTLDPPCRRRTEQTLTVTATNFTPDSRGYVVFDAEGPEQASQIRIPIGASGSFSAQFKTTASGRGVGIDANDLDGVVARTRWEPCPPPGATTTTTRPPGGGGGPTTTTSTTRPGDPPPSTTTTIPTIVTIPTPTPGAALIVTPSLGPGGFVATALGSGFPPNALVALGWSPGIGIFSALTHADGTFSSPALVMNRDVLGPRTLVASSGGVAATASFLVVPSTVQPSGKDVAQITRVRRFLQR